MAPAACVVSQSVKASWIRAASRIAATSATRPSADCTRENATRCVCGPISAASSSSGTCRTTTPRASATTNGYVSELKSPVTHSTSAPAGTAAASTLTKEAVCEPTATDPTGTPTSDAYDARTPSTTPP